MRGILCGRPLQEILKLFAALDLVFDNTQIIVMFICFAFPSWLPKSYSKYLIPTLHPTFANASAPSIHRPHVEDLLSNPPEGESDFLLFLASLGFIICISSTIFLFYWLWTGATERNLSKCKKWLCVRMVFISFLIIVTLFKLTSQNYYAFDVIFDLLKIYSVYEIFIVKSFIDTQNIETPVLLKTSI